MRAHPQAVSEVDPVVGRVHRVNPAPSLFGQQYGAAVAKVVLAQTRRLPGWVLPAAGGTLAVVVAVLWYTSALWYYNGYQLPGI
jgi:hypothetical protein